MLNLVALSLLALSLWIGNSAISLFLGIVLALLFKLPQDFLSKKYGSKILQTGIVFLGGSLSLGTVYETNTDFFLWICLYVILAFAFVIFLGKLMGISERLSFLLASGTAVCGGTAIASVAPSIKAKPEEHMNRVIKQGDLRPMSSNPRAMDDLNSILKERKNLYLQADAIVNTENKNKNDSYKELKEIIIN